MKSNTWQLGSCSILVGCLLAAVGHAEPACPQQAPIQSLDQLAQMTWPELEQLYRGSEAGAIPQGYAAGKALYCPCSRLAAVKAHMTDAVWRGKVFDAASCTLVNQWCGFRAIRAAVYYGPSWLDGKTSIVMDYSATSRVWADVRDEMREVAPGLYLGRMYRSKAGRPEEFQIFFALQVCPR